jgi:hypothetical protein
MPIVPDPDYWTIIPAAAQDRPLVRINPLAFLNPGECGAWVATLQALRALPNTAVAPARRAGLADEGGEPGVSAADPSVAMPDLNDACIA